MKITTDTSVMIAVILNEPEKQHIIALTRGNEIIAPKSVLWEVGNAFSAMLKRKRLDLNAVMNALDAFNSIPITYMDIDLKNALNIASKCNLYAYDAYFIDCAIRYHTPFLTLDKTLSRIAQSYQIQVLEVSR